MLRPLLQKSVGTRTLASFATHCWLTVCATKLPLQKRQWTKPKLFDERASTADNLTLLQLAASRSAISAQSCAAFPHSRSSRRPYLLLDLRLRFTLSWHYF